MRNLVLRRISPQKSSTVLQQRRAAPVSGDSQRAPLAPKVEHAVSLAVPPLQQAVPFAVPFAFPFALALAFPLAFPLPLSVAEALPSALLLPDLELPEVTSPIVLAFVDPREASAGQHVAWVIRVERRDVHRFSRHVIPAGGEANSVAGVGRALCVGEIVDVPARSCAENRRSGRVMCVVRRRTQHR